MNVVLGVSGGIAAYKAPDLVRRLREAGADVRVILTPNATRFVSVLSLAAVSGHGVISDQWGDPSSGGVDHIELARWAEMLLIAPATANIVAKLATGIADDALSTYALAHRSHLMVVPAMNSFMFSHPTVRANLATLRSRGAVVIDPDSGLLACGEEGVGRMPDPPLIAREVQRILSSVRDLDGVRVLVTAGPTREALDPVRFLSNRSSGKMGYALAAAARARGAKVTLVSGPVALATPDGVDRVDVVSAAEMRDAVMSRVDSSDVVIKAAAVADYAPTRVEPRKIKKGSAETLSIDLVRTPDILGEIGRMNPRPLLVAFAAETDQLEAYAKAKLESKGADMIVANDVSNAAIGFDAEDNEVTILRRSGETVRLPKASKREIATRIVDLVVEEIARKRSTENSEFRIQNDK